MPISQALKHELISRSGNCCEYCLSQDKYSPVFFTIDHIIPISHGGGNDIDNLAYACSLCNRLKWNKVNGLDAKSNKLVPIYNPRVHIWREHFSWNSEYFYVLGLTAIGRVTIETLKLNRPKLIQYRKTLFEIGKHPPDLKDKSYDSPT